MTHLCIYLTTQFGLPVGQRALASCVTWDPALAV